MERLDGYAGYVVDSHESDSKPDLLELGFRFCEDMPTGSASFGAFRAERVRYWSDILHEHCWDLLLCLLGYGQCAAPAFGAESVDCLFVF